MQCLKTLAPTYIFTLEIQVTEWDYKPGDLIKVPVIAKSEKSALKILNDRCWGGGYPEFEVKAIEEIKGNVLFTTLIQESVFR